MFDSLIRFIDSMRSVSLFVAGCSLSLGVRCRLVFAVAWCSLSLGVDAFWLKTRERSAPLYKTVHKSLSYKTVLFLVMKRQTLIFTVANFR